MSVMLVLASSGGGQTPTTKVYTTSQTITIPANVSNLVLLSGQGAAGRAASSTYINSYEKTTTLNDTRNDLGGQVYSTEMGKENKNGVAPAPYCDPYEYYVGFGDVLNRRQTCYTFRDTSYWSNIAATTGAAATGFGQTFPGGVAGPATSKTFNNVAVTPGGQYPLVIPAGGSITVSYY